MSLRTVTIVVPWLALVSSNQRNTRRGGKAHSKAYKTSRAAINAIAATQIKEKLPLFPEGDVTMRARFYPPDYRRRDEMNFAKVLGDSLNGVIYRDDSQLRDVSFLRVDVDEANPRAEIEVTGLTTTGG